MKYKQFTLTYFHKARDSYCNIGQENALKLLFSHDISQFVNCAKIVCQQQTQLSIHKYTILEYFCMQTTSVYFFTRRERRAICVTAGADDAGTISSSSTATSSIGSVTTTAFLPRLQYTV